MALIDLKSDLSWYGKTPPAVNNITDRDAEGFTTKEQQLNPSRFVGISGGQFSYTGPMGFGILGTQNNFENTHNEGFTLNIMPKGTSRPESQFIGISNNEYQSTSLYGQLSNLSNLSTDREDTKYIASGDSFSREVAGFDFQGNIVSFRNPTALDAFPHDPYSNGGDAKRIAQLGTGTKFPISPLGKQHLFDKERLGFSKDSKYETVYGKQSNSSDNKNAGLANTYTANSPIDDMYNKFNLRDDATPNPGYAKAPFILRGIQREGSSDPQRWGLGETTVGAIFSTFDLPRAGILTSAERSAIDAVRIGKFLISPKGIGFLARQFGYQLMNPNTENIKGTAIGLPATQLYNPLSAPGQALVGGLLGSGKFTRHTGLTNLPFGGGGEYNTTKQIQRLANTLVSTKNGRMIKLWDQWKGGNGFVGQGWSALTAPKGPGSILGIGVTSHTRRSMTDLAGAKSPYGGIPGGLTAMLQNFLGLGGGESTYNTSFGDNFYRWSIDEPYEPEPNSSRDDFLEARAAELNDTRGETTNVKHVLNKDKAASEDPFNSTYKTLTYGELPNREPGTTTNIDFRTQEDYDETIENNPLASRLGTSTDEGGEGDSFNGGGKNEATDESGTPKVGRLRHKTQPYETLKEEASIRSDNQNTDRNFLTGEDYDTSIENNPLAAKLNTVTDAGGEEVEFEGGGKADSTIEGSETTPLKTYDTNTYQEIKEKAAERTDSLNPTNIDFRTNGDYDTSAENNPLGAKASEADDGGGKNVGMADSETELTPAEPGHFKVLGYANLRRDNPNKRNFGYDKGGLGAEYASDSTVEGKYGYKPYSIIRDSIVAQPDPIQSLEGDYSGDIKDLINFKFQALRTDDTLDSPSETPVIFRAYINSINDSFAPSWQENQDQGRADAKIMYEGWSRSIGLDFMVPAHSKGELTPIWSKLEKLAKLTYPIYPAGGSGFTGTYCKVTIGNLYKGEAMYVTDLSYDWDNETPWELEDGTQLPLYTQVSMTLGWIGKHRPDVNTHVFTYNAKSGPATT